MRQTLWNKMISLAARSALLLVTVALAASTATAQTVVTPINGGTAGGTPVVINNTSGSQTDPKISGDLVAYTDVPTGTIRYYSFMTNVDSPVPRVPGTSDSLSSVSGPLIAFSRQMSDRRTTMVFDTATNVVFEVAPQVGSSRFATALGGPTVAFVEQLVNSGDIMVYDVAASGPLVNLSSSAEIDGNPAIAPAGNVVVWERCDVSFTDCGIFKSLRLGGIWAAPALVSDTASYELNPATDGAFIVYDSNRPSVTGSDIYFQPLAGGTERQLQIPGTQRNPSISAGVIALESVDDAPGSKSDLYIYIIASNMLVRVTDTTAANEVLNEVTVLPNGDIRVVWAADDGIGGELNVYAQTFTPPAPPLVALTPINGGFASGIQVVVNNGPGDQTDPHVSGDLVSYSHTSAAEIGYYSFLTNAHAVIPKAAPGNVDTLSDVSGARIAFSRAFPDRRSSMVFDTETGALLEIAPQTGSSRFATAVGGNTVTFVEHAVGNADLMVFDLATPGPLINLGAGLESDLNPAVAPSGNAVVWERCWTGCSIWKSTRVGGIWGAATLVSNSAAYDSNPDTDGTNIIYDSNRASATGPDIYYQALNAFALSRGTGTAPLA